MKLLKFIITSLMCILYFSQCFKSQPDILTVEQAREDIDFYFNFLKKTNPKLDAFISLESIDSLNQSVKSKCTTTMTRNQFLYMLKKTSKYFDAHTRLAAGYVGESFAIDSCFPYVGIRDSKMLYNGYEILEINNLPGFLLVDDLDKMVSLERYEDDRIDQMNLELNALLFHIYDIKAPYLCKVKNNETNAIEEIEIDFVHIQSLEKALRSHRTNKHVARTDFDIFPEDSIAVIYYNTSNIYDSNGLEELDKILVGYFTKIKDSGIKHLFIDLSENGGGGDEVHDYYFKHLKSKPYENSLKVYFSEETVLSTRKQIENILIRDNIKIDIDSNDNTVINGLKSSQSNMNNVLFRSYDFFKHILEGHLYVNTANRINKEKNIIVGNPNGFEGDVYIIMGKRTFSAGFSFCDAAKKSKAGILVGDIAGQRSPFGGNSLFKSLPNSQLSVQCPSQYVVFNNVVTDSLGFLHPDIPYPLDHQLGIEDYKKIITKRSKIK